MKYSKRTRDQAALICQVAASNPDPHPIPGTTDNFDYWDVCDHLGIHRASDACQLALLAWDAVIYEGDDKVWGADWTKEVDAEAEARLRTGWPQ